MGGGGGGGSENPCYEQSELLSVSVGNVEWRGKR